MENSIQVFVFRNAPVRVHIDGSGEPWWVAKDVCEVLGLENNRQALSRLHSTQKADVIISDTSSNGTTQNRAYLTVNEPGLYRLIFTSRRPEAEAFQEWVAPSAGWLQPMVRVTSGNTVIASDGILSDGKADISAALVVPYEPGFGCCPAFDNRSD